MASKRGGALSDEDTTILYKIPDEYRERMKDHVRNKYKSDPGARAELYVMLGLVTPAEVNPKYRHLVDFTVDA